MLTILKKRWPSRRLIGYIAVLAGCMTCAVLASWQTIVSDRLDNYATDVLFRILPPKAWTPQSIVLGIDEETYLHMGGTMDDRAILAKALDLIAPAHPKAVAIDVILADAGDPAQNRALAAAMHRTPNLVLSCEMIPTGWEDPLPIFARQAAALGHIHAHQDVDGVSRQIPLQKVIGDSRRWALSLEAYRLSHGGQPILESPTDLQVDGVRIPAPVDNGDRPLRIRWSAPIPTIGVYQLETHPALLAQFRNKTVFLGVTALTAQRDRMYSPFGTPVPGPEIHAHAFETMAQGEFLTPASDHAVLGVCILMAAAAGLTFWFLSGWPAYLLAGLLLIAAHLVPAFAFRSGVLFPYMAAISGSWFPIVGAATYKYFLVRGQWRKSEFDKARYQQAIHFVTHEMRTPLTAIQGSSEIMGRYTLNDDKRKQIAQMINSESKRLARMIQTFLDVERLSDGQMELKQEPFGAKDVITVCVERARPLAERKQIRVYCGHFAEEVLTGDRELMEYAVYNLLTNAIKYSPAETDVHIDLVRDGENIRLSVKDQGIGMDARELRNIFKKFYRTKKAEASGESGTGIGLSIVEEIVVRHGGRMEVASKPGKGSTFTMVMPVRARISVG
jgi:signal transduction histidine kinase